MKIRIALLLVLVSFAAGEILANCGVPPRDGRTIYDAGWKPPRPVPDLDCWLQANPDVSGKLLFLNQPIDPVRLKAAFGRAWDFYEWGLHYWRPEPFPEIPEPIPNQLTLADEAGVRHVLTLEMAENLYYAHLANVFAVELGGWVPWSITTYDWFSLLVLLRGTWGWMDGGAVELSSGVLGYMLPTAPIRIVKWMRDTGFNATQSRAASIAAAVEWSRNGMTHFYGPLTIGNFQQTWGARGFVPIDTLLYGNANQYGWSHWTAGCWGTYGTLRQMLAAINIPVYRNTFTNEHAVPWFVSEQLYLLHGDDPYNLYSKAQPRYPVTDLLISGQEFTAVYEPKYQVIGDKALSHRPMDLRMRMPSYQMAREYCTDTQNGIAPMDGGVFAPYLQAGYTFAETQGGGLWTNLDTMIQQYGGCGNIPQN